MRFLITLLLVSLAAAGGLFFLHINSALSASLVGALPPLVVPLVETMIAHPAKTALFIFAGVLGFDAVWKLKKDLPSFGQVQINGISKEGYQAIVRLFIVAAIIEIPYMFLSIAYDFSLAYDFAVLVGLLLGIAIVFVYLFLTRPKFRSLAFATLVALPLLLPGAGLAAKHLGAGVGAIMPIVWKVVEPRAYPIAVRLFGTRPPATAIPKQTVVGSVSFEHTTQMGHLGDSISDMTYVREDFKSWNVRLNQAGKEIEQGIDRVYVKRPLGQITQVRFVENKVGTGALVPDKRGIRQGTWEFVEDRLMKCSTYNPKCQQLLIVVRHQPKKVELHVNRYDVQDGSSTSSRITRSGSSTSRKTERWEPSFVRALYNHCWANIGYCDLKVSGMGTLLN